MENLRNIFSILLQSASLSIQPVEGYHRQVRKVTKNKGVFPSDTALEKLVYFAYRDIREKWTMLLKEPWLPLYIRRRKDAKCQKIFVPLPSKIRINEDR